MTALRRFRRAVVASVAALAFAAPLFAQIPAGYYDAVDTTNAASLRATLHAVIDDHSRFPYTSGGTDTWDILELAQEDPNNPARVLDLYKNESVVKQGGGNAFYDREHTWPKSYGFPDDNADNYPHNDCHMLWLADGAYNGARSNKPFRTCSAVCSEYPTDVNDGQGGDPGSYPGGSNWSSGSLTAGTWETWIGRRGDVARSLLYADVRYEGGNHGITGSPEPDLILTDIEALIAASNTGNNEDEAYMGMLSVLLQWHAQDPVDDWERDRNDGVYAFQGNRNPFVDHPEWVDCLFLGSCSGGPDVTPPATPTGLVATASDSSVGLDWDDNLELDLAGYTVYRAGVSGGPYAALNGALIGGSAYTDASALNGNTYYYVVSASDSSSNESGDSSEDSATPMAGTGGGLAWINELHYDNASTDVGEFVEVAGPAGLDLSGWSLVGYNGNGGAVYTTVALSGILSDQQGCIGTASFGFGQIQNGSPDGMALVAPGGVVVEFLSYEGSMLAVGGPADGLTSTDMGVVESFTTPVGFSLQRGGTGSEVGDFVWQAEQAETPGLPNTGQTFDGCTTSGWTDLGFALAGVSGEPLLVGTGSMAAGTPYDLDLTGAAPSAVCGLFLSFSSSPVPFKGGSLVPFPFVAVVTLSTDVSGQVLISSSVDPSTPAGISLYVQYWIQDAAAVLGLSASNAVVALTS